MDSQEVKRRLKQLERNGQINPDDVVEDARDPTSPLHSYFEWNDAEAAHQHRLSQARQLIRSVRFETVVDNTPMKVPVYVRTAEAYENIVLVQANRDRSREVVMAEMHAIIHAVNRARIVAAFLGSPEDLDEIKRLAASVIRKASGDEAPAGTA